MYRIRDVDAMWELSYLSTRDLQSGRMIFDNINRAATFRSIPRNTIRLCIEQGIKVELERIEEGK